MRFIRDCEEDGNPCARTDGRENQGGDSVRFIRDCDGDLYIEIPGRPGWFASALTFQRGKKYVELYSYEEREIVEEGPFAVEWEAKQ